MSNNPLLKRPSNSDLDVTIRKGGRSMHNIIRAIIGIVNTVSFVGVFYYFIPGFNHIGTQGTSWQPTLAFLCITVFLISVSLIPSKKESK